MPSSITTLLITGKVEGWGFRILSSTLMSHLISLVSCILTASEFTVCKIGCNFFRLSDPGYCFYFWLPTQQILLLILCVRKNTYFQDICDMSTGTLSGWGSNGALAFIFDTNLLWEVTPCDNCPLMNNSKRAKHLCILWGNVANKSITTENTFSFAPASAIEYLLTFLFKILKCIFLHSLYNHVSYIFL